MNLGRAITLCRKQRGWNQAQLAEKADISVSYLSLLEQNKRKDPTLSVIQKIAEALAVPSGILFFLAADQTELAGLPLDLQEKLSFTALQLLNEEPPEQALL
ncbi:helix-turn-helix domain-containing protein [Burkholderia gladioli]|uniref:helix-turn-helix domain-containing protein n=1 Tax=Burkholderia gladioli TaxID=28095 RepID=UPI00163DEE28|nr:helix-turn-helix transcriptional regulator [Burkholderia gladioli]